MTLPMASISVRRDRDRSASSTACLGDLLHRHQGDEARLRRHFVLDPADKAFFKLPFDKKFGGCRNQDPRRNKGDEKFRKKPDLHSFSAQARLMPDALSRDHVNDHVRDPLGVIRYPLQALGDLHDVEADLDLMGIFHHEREQLPEDLIVELVDDGVLCPDSMSQLDIPANQGVQALADHPPHNLGHPRQIDVGLDLRQIVQDEDLLGDLGGHVPDPLQVAGDLDRRRDEAQIPRSGLPKGQQTDALLLQRDVEPVDLVVVADDPSRQFGVSLHKRDGALFQGLFRQGAQVDEAVLDLLELSLIFRAGMPFLFHIASVCPDAMGRRSTEPSGNIVLRLFHVRIGEDLLRGVEFDQLSHVEETCVFRDARRLLHVVGHDDDGVALLERVDKLLDLRRGDGIERRCRLVHEQDVRLHGERPGDAETLLLAAGEGHGGFVQDILDLVPENRLFQALLHQGLQGAIVPDAREFRREGDVVVDRFRKGIGFLKNHPDPLTDLHGIHVGA